MELDLNEVVSSVTGKDGVVALTKGVIITEQLRSMLRNFLKVADPKGYEMYRSIKYPEGGGSRTDATDRAAVKFVFQRCGELAAEHYVSRRGQ